MDALSDLIRVMRLTGGVFLEAELSAPFSVYSHVEAEECRPWLPEARQIISLHYVIGGTLHVAVEGEAPVVLRAGDIVLLPRNDRHVLGSQPGLAPVHVHLDTPQGQGLPRLVHGGGGDRAHVVCGFLGSETTGSPLLASLPRLMTSRAEGSATQEWLASSFTYAARQLGEPGSASMLSRLTELMFVEAVRRYVAQLPAEQRGWFASLRDPFVSRALSLLHARPARAWTSEELAGLVGLSRSAFAERFTSMVGNPPMHYLAQWRMQLAAQRLLASRDPLARIAGEIGYESEAAFSRAFKRHYGVPPAAWRAGRTADEHALRGVSAS